MRGRRVEFDPELLSSRRQKTIIALPEMGVGRESTLGPRGAQLVPAGFVAASPTASLPYLSSPLLSFFEPSSSFSTFIFLFVSWLEID